MTDQAKPHIQSHPAAADKAPRRVAERAVNAELASAYAASAALDSAMAQEARAADNDGLSHDAW
jgi:hypothetical protein